MRELDIDIGKLEVNATHLCSELTAQRDPEVDGEPYHYFVVEVRDNIARIFVAGKRSHSALVTHFSLEEDCIGGGGFCYTNRLDQLVLDGYSGDFGAIPYELAERFAWLIAAELVGKHSLVVEGARADIDENKLNGFWKKAG